MKKISLFLSFLFVVFLLIFSSCEKESFTTDPSDKLTFSLDTLMFDTVFTQIGSITKSFKVHNIHDKSIRISEVRLAKQNDFFHINIDGVPTDIQEEIEILPNDSIYIFVEVTIDPDLPLSASPYIIEEDILFQTNGNQQKVHLTAWGQDAIYLPKKNGKGIDYRLVCDSDGSIEWNDKKPYVIYGRLFVDSCELVLPQGCQIYVHGGLARVKDDFGNIQLDSLGRSTIYNDGAIVFYNRGKLTVNGTADEPVIIQGDRLDDTYDDIYGQWLGFYFLNQTRHNFMNHLIIRNAINGIYIDSLSQLDIESSIIYNTIGSGITARHARMNVKNTLIYNNLSSAVNITYGGNYRFDNCTFVSENNNSAAFVAANYTCRDADCQIVSFYPLVLTMQNNIVVGDQDDELVIVDGTKGEYPELINYTVKNTIITMKDLLEKPDYNDNFKDCIKLEKDNLLFINKDEFDYHLDTFSVAEQKALPLSNVPTDLDGVMRDGATPDIGCYEFID